MLINFILSSTILYVFLLVLFGSVVVVVVVGVLLLLILLLLILFVFKFFFFEALFVFKFEGSIFVNNNGCTKNFLIISTNQNFGVSAQSLSIIICVKVVY